MSYKNVMYICSLPKTSRMTSSRRDMYSFLPPDWAKEDTSTQPQPQSPVRVTAGELSQRHSLRRIM